MHTTPAPEHRPESLPSTPVTAPRIVLQMGGAAVGAAGAHPQLQPTVYLPSRRQAA